MSVVFSDRARTKLRNQSVSATTWTPLALWHGGDVDVYLQAAVDGAAVAFRLSTAADGTGDVIDIPAGAGVELRTEPRLYYVYSAVAVQMQALIEETV